MEENMEIMNKISEISKAHNWAVTRTFFAVLSDILLLASVFEKFLKRFVDSSYTQFDSDYTQ